MPTALEFETARAREQLAQMMRDDLQRAKEVCGDGAKAYAKWVMTDKTGREAKRIVYCCRREGSWEPPAPNDDERLTASDHPGYLFGGILWALTYLTHYFRKSFRICD